MWFFFLFLHKNVFSHSDVAYFLEIQKWKIWFYWNFKKFTKKYNCAFLGSQTSTLKNTTFVDSGLPSEESYQGFDELDQLDSATARSISPRHHEDFDFIDSFGSDTEVETDTETAVQIQNFHDSGKLSQITEESEELSKESEDKESEESAQREDKENQGTQNRHQGNHPQPQKQVQPTQASLFGRLAHFRWIKPTAGEDEKQEEQVSVFSKRFHICFGV